MLTTLQNFCAETFLSDYWQKKPGVFRQALPNFADPLDEHDLAGLTQEPEVDSRIIQHHKGKWAVFHGPFEEFSTPCQGKWTLLVQGVDRYLDETSDLMDSFSFIPYWRMDDLMVSFAVEGAGVGPHTDQYDVFLLQGKGSRRWQVGAPGIYQTVHPHQDLRQIEGFEPVIDTVLQPGDILYVPPNWPHDGVAEEDCMTYSIGFRAPDQSQLFQYLLDHIMSCPELNQRYTDTQLALSASPGVVTNKHISALTALMQQALARPEWPSELVRCLSEQHLSVEVPTQLYTEQELFQEFESGLILQRLPGCRPLFGESTESSGSDFTFCIDGEEFTVDATVKEALLPCLNGRAVTFGCIEQAVDKLAFLQVLCKLTNKGYWVFTDE